MKLSRVGFLLCGIVAAAAATTCGAQAGDPNQLVSSSGRTFVAGKSAEPAKIRPGFAGTEPSPSRSVADRTVIGKDGRRKVRDTSQYPASAVTLITNSDFYCSGFLVGKDTVVTQGSCLHSGAGGDFRDITSFRIYPGASRDGTFGPCRAYDLLVPNGWSEASFEDYNYGVIKLKCNIGKQVGWFGIFWTKDSLVGKESNLSSYPGDKPYPTQWRSTERIRGQSARMLFYPHDTAPGSIGGPVFGKHSDCTPCAMGIYNVRQHGNNGPHHDFNHGVRINKEVFANIVSIIEWNPPN